ncbi:Uu.00g023580.m01.CDS01 [Anthostomella pinea]|uniref:Uu.00g023580.m01.CDS01 n=1 Tax=Anthostomella pinea TaxID=933095 RepID=A0AAI8YQY3_9PEZI|nr:Uu.00g023580.m01.CDS01 [Anthostomella pinea]
MPTRVIDLGLPQLNQPAKLILTDGLRQSYLALSYCWGEGTKHCTELRRENIATLMVSIDERELSKTHRDAFQLARSLHYRYIWIDALCIVQQEIADWEFESRRMADVYGNAALTIVAGRARDSRDGFLENPWTPASGPCAIPYSKRTPSDCGEGTQNRAMGNVLVSLRRSRETGPTDSRGWCFQEAVLSTCLIVYGKEQMYFQCQKGRIWEDGAEEDGDRFSVRSSLRAWPSSLVSTSAVDSISDEQTSNSDTAKPAGNLRGHVLNQWYQNVVSPFSRRQLTMPHDCFAAIASLAKLVQIQVHSRYLAGLWEDNIVSGLLGLLLAQIAENKFRRLGHFVVACEWWILEGEEQELTLV